LMEQGLALVSAGRRVTNQSGSRQAG
jgi:hypothetical protein